MVYLERMFATIDFYVRLLVRIKYGRYFMLEGGMDDGFEKVRGGKG